MSETRVPSSDTHQLLRPRGEQSTSSTSVYTVTNDTQQLPRRLKGAIIEVCYEEAQLVPCSNWLVLPNGKTKR